MLLEQGAVSLDADAPGEVAMNLPVASGTVATSSGDILSPSFSARCRVDPPTQAEKSYGQVMILMSVRSWIIIVSMVMGSVKL